MLLALLLKLLDHILCIFWCLRALLTSIIRVNTILFEPTLYSPECMEGKGPEVQMQLFA